MARPKIKPENRKTEVASTRLTEEENGKLNRVASRLKNQKNLKSARSAIMRIALENLFARLEKQGKL